MQSRWVRWIAYLLLATLVVVTSCQAMAGPGTHATVAAQPPAAPSLAAPFSAASVAEARG
jgi:hypothetical protein